tara:strand:- start:1266 stop:1973 length:708 start_codon:yes stop_codon:yes gene_type:complete
MNEHYVYIHLNPSTNEIFYVGKGKGHRKTNQTSRNRKWIEYVSKLSEPFKVLVLKDNLSEKKALELEKKVLNKIDFHYNDLTTNIAESEPDLDSGIFIQFAFNESNSSSNEKLQFRFEKMSDNEIIKTLLDFPNELKFSELKKEFDEIYDSFHDNYDELEEIDEDVFIDIESALDSINDLIDEYKVSDKENITEFLTDLERERFDVEFILDEKPKGKQKKFTKRIINWIDKKLNK